MRLTPTQSDRAPGVLLGQAGGDVPTVPYEFVRALADQLAEITGGGLGSTEMTSGYPATDFVSLMRRSLHNVPAPGTEPANHVEMRLRDNGTSNAKPDLAFCVADTAAVIVEIQAEGHGVPTP